MYHYKTCGLDSVYLVNGYHEIETAEGNAISIVNLEGLHRAIAHSIVEMPRRLKGAEIRFLRVEMGLSQKRLASLMEKTDQTIANWEKGETPVTKEADMFIRQLYRQSVGEDPAFSELLKRINDLDHEITRLEMQIANDHWSAAA